MLNSAIISGNLGADPEVFYSPSSGDPVARFNLAFSSGKDKTSWVKVVCFKKLASAAEKYLHKGARIAINGILDQSTWETEGGEQRSSMQVIARSIEFIKTDGRGFSGGEDGSSGKAVSHDEDAPY